MSKAQQSQFSNTADEHQKLIVQMIEDVSRTHGIDPVWSDWVEISAMH